MDVMLTIRLLSYMYINNIYFYLLSATWDWLQYDLKIQDHLYGHNIDNVSRIFSKGSVWMFIAYKYG